MSEVTVLKLKVILKNLKRDEDEDENPVGKSYNQSNTDIKRRRGSHAPKGVNPAKLTRAELAAIRKQRKQKAKEKLRHEEVDEAVAGKDALAQIYDIVNKKQHGKVLGVSVDLFTASAMQQVYQALNSKNKDKVEKMLKDKRGVMTFADFAMSQAKK